MGIPSDSTFVLYAHDWSRGPLLHLWLWSQARHGQDLDHCELTAFSAPTNSTRTGTRLEGYRSQPGRYPQLFRHWEGSKLTLEGSPGFQGVMQYWKSIRQYWKGMYSQPGRHPQLFPALRRQQTRIGTQLERSPSQPERYPKLSRLS